MRTRNHYEKMLSNNPSASVGYVLAADIVFAAKHGVIDQAEAHLGDEWRTLALTLKSRYGGSLSVDQVRRAVEEGAEGK